MTPVGAQHVIDSMAMRIFEIEDAQNRLEDEKRQLRLRIAELELQADEEVIQPKRIVNLEELSVDEMWDFLQ